MGAKAAAAAVLGAGDLFLGDWSDPWVRGLAKAVPAGVTRLAWEAGRRLPARCPETLRDGGTAVIHRPGLHRVDADQVALWRRANAANAAEEAKTAITTTPGRIVVCYGAYTRSAVLEHWLPAVDVAIEEALALAVLPKFWSTTLRPDADPEEMPSFRVTVVSGRDVMRGVLGDLCVSAGFATVTTASWAEEKALTLRPAWNTMIPTAVLWDVPVLDGGWEEDLQNAVAAGLTVIPIVGFLDRDFVNRALRRGAVACLDWPCDADDLAFVLRNVMSRS